MYKKNKQNLAQLRSTAGFTLIEVMVAVLILSIGILGIAGLQMNAQKFSRNAYLNTLATLAAHDMLERVRANPAGQKAGYYHLPGTEKVASCYTTAGCSSSQMAQNDMFEWAGDPVQGILTMLPKGSGVICKDSTPDDGDSNAPACDDSGSIYAIKVWWSNSDDTDEMHRMVITSRFN